MDWTIRFSYGVLLTSFTGSILFLAWQAAGWLLEKTGFICARFELLKVVAAGFLIPAAYLFLNGKEERREIGRGYLFSKTYALLLAGEIFTAVWAGGVLLLLAILLRDSWRLHRKNKNLFCCEAAVRTQFQDIYKSLGGKGRRLQVYQSYHHNSPCMCGILHPKVILPVQNYSKEELRVIFAHEITHYLQGDAVLKWSVLLLRMVHFFNPAAWILCRKVLSFSEYACDFRACNALGEGPKQYFEVIADIAVSSSREVLAAQLSESRHELVKRIDKMKLIKKNGRTKLGLKATAALLTGILFITSSAAVYGAALKSADGYEYLYHMTDFGAEEEYIPPTYNRDEYMACGLKDSIIVRTGKVNEICHILTSFNWTVNSGEMVETDSFPCEKGNTISINLYTSPENTSVKAGIVLPNGKKQYIWTRSCVTNYQFSISSSGDYKVFVENHSNTSVNITGCHTFSRNRWDSIMHYTASNNEEGAHTYRIYCTECDYSWIITLPCSYDQSGHHSTPF